MPGILPMKVIKVGSTAVTRIAQACDRCRSKKIRCDGFQPCTQCVNVGFECKTSDKLSRRAFPRGYTESLEERVRTLEAEVRDLKQLLDEKDEKIDLLSKTYSQSPCRNNSRRRPSAPDLTIDGTSKVVEDQATFKVHQSPQLHRSGQSDPYFEGISSSSAFIDCFKRKLQESGKAYSDFKPELFSVNCPIPDPYTTVDSLLWAPPPRVAADQMVNIFFQEWSPLFPIVHKPTFLHFYEQYMADQSSITDPRILAQLYLVFGIAALSCDDLSSHTGCLCEKQWMTVLKVFAAEPTLLNIQLLALASLYSIQIGDSTRLVEFRSLAAGFAQRLGLHLSQKRFAFGVLTCETRKKVFWSLYTIDCFSAASLGVPRLIREDDIQCEYPADADDDYVTEKGFQPMLPGEYTKLSSGLALFRASRILAKVLDKNYPSASSYELSMESIESLGEELEKWWTDLAPHLRLHFEADKPSTKVISSRSPLLCLTYDYIKTLIYRPAASADLGDRGASSLVTIAASSKRIVQVLQLLAERGMNFTHCLNKTETIFLCGFGLLYQTVELDKDGMMMKDRQRMTRSVVDMLNRRTAPGCSEFRRLGSTLLSASKLSKGQSRSESQRASSASSSTYSGSLPDSPASKTRTLDAQNCYPRQKPQVKIEKTPSVNNSPQSEKSSLSSASTSSRLHTTIRPSPLEQSISIYSSIETDRTKSSQKHGKSGSKGSNRAKMNLDYFSLASENKPQSKTRTDSNTSDLSVWDQILSTLDGGTGQEEAVYDCQQVDTMLLSPHEQLLLTNTMPVNGDGALWSQDMFSYSDASLQPIQPPQSVLSFSEDSLTSGEDFSSVDHGSDSDSIFRSITLPTFNPDAFTNDDGSEFNALATSVTL